MQLEHKQKIAMFRFGVIAELVGRNDLQRGEREALIAKLSSQSCDIPFSDKRHISRSSIRLWLARYQQSGRRLESLFPKGREDAGRSRSIDAESGLAMVKLKQEPNGIPPIRLTPHFAMMAHFRGVVGYHPFPENATTAHHVQRFRSPYASSPTQAASRPL